MASKHLAWALLTLSCGAYGNDGWIGYGGAPRLLGSHPSVQMVSEVVSLTVYQKTIAVQCDFVFKNHGAATTVRIGFPDTVEPPDPDDRYNHSLLDFKSFVDGKLVKTYLLFGKLKGWRVKSVRFSAGQTRRIRNTYRMVIGLSGLGVDRAGESYYNLFAGYVVSTGASWKGNIERSEINVRFSTRARVVGKSLDVRIPTYEETDTFEEVIRLPKNIVMIDSAPGKPIVRGRTMRFVRTNWKPKESDDLQLRFGLTKAG